MSQYKTCPKCRQTKSLLDFHKHKRNYDGLRSRCKPCHSADTELWRINNLEKANATRKQWADNNKEKSAHIKRNYWKNNPDKISASSRKWQQANKDHVREVANIWIANNKEKVNATQHRRRARKASNGVFRVLDKELIKLYSSKCFYCPSKEAIEADHVLPISRGGSHGIGNLLPACRSCNASKGNKTIMEFRVWKSKQEETPQLPTHS